jgi:hypothetical protein
MDGIWAKMLSSTTSTRGTGGGRAGCSRWWWRRSLVGIERGKPQLDAGLSWVGGFLADLGYAYLSQVERYQALG